ncbi:HNH endonuclease family protein [Streptomyces smaragdinus]|uniref:HNH endonuclease family protein n=1 Tax=Streptomyces smaragdinus TaxID=2585196 RepID=UPI002B2115A6|nr:HNH endonuclease family protein [Streptomyces smaragdinus]
MIKNLTRGLAAISLALASLTAAAPAHAAAPDPSVLPLGEAITLLPLGAESREGYTREAFKHWNSGANPTDGCNTRNEVLLAEAVTPPTVGSRCALTGGSWWSYYDNTIVTAASNLDIDHMVPLAEAWDSGASAWTPERREAYANDLGQSTSLIAVTAGSNRSKSDQDPAEWLPPAPEAVCRYATEWTATKLRWGLTIDTAEQIALQALAVSCPTSTVVYEPA